MIITVWRSGSAQTRIQTRRVVNPTLPASPETNNSVISLDDGPELITRLRLYEIDIQLSELRGLILHLRNGCLAVELSHSSHHGYAQETLRTNCCKVGEG